MVDSWFSMEPAKKIIWKTKIKQTFETEMLGFDVEVQPGVAIVNFHIQNSIFKKKQFWRFLD